MNGRALQFDVSAPLAFLRERRQLIDAAISALEALGPSPQAPREATAMKVGSSKAPAKIARISPPKTDDDAAPISRRGKLPTLGVQHLYCSTEAARRAKVMELKSEGYRRASAGERLEGGLFDVRASGDEDGSATVLWREKAEEVA